MLLYLFRLGTIAGIDLPVPGYLIRHPDGGDILVDTGPVPGGPIVVAPNEDLVIQLAGLGVTPDQVRTVVCTHLDPDHCGSHHRFPNAEFIIQREHWALARAGGIPRLLLAKDSWDAPGLRYREVDGDCELLPGVELIASGGHVPGHQSVLVRLPETGPLLLAADAIPNGEALDSRTRPIFPLDLDEAATRASTAKLVTLAEQEGALIVRGHDARQWPTLRHAPAAYR
ncbi:N-acyl homoserine lactonase family protein [Nocardia sp. CDC153]|uniref:N-acyl homoserine lactonase family protein n=1 Tax=Nocardia sp. CDC153 TaxID=3112167 RepID=UPI002DBF6F3A|nr:N-acyl homoserine lactonase family protein [Nocardia sp. CDC153]MEC3952026.1 N-acyl homoserine lactonase family protein [Nocardia sp. CDC153]